MAKYEVVLPTIWGGALVQPGLIIDTEVELKGSPFKLLEDPHAAEIQAAAVKLVAAAAEAAKVAAEAEAATALTPHQKAAATRAANAATAANPAEADPLA